MARQITEGIVEVDMRRNSALETLMDRVVEIGRPRPQYWFDWRTNDVIVHFPLLPDDPVEGISPYIVDAHEQLPGYSFTQTVSQGPPVLQYQGSLFDGELNAFVGYLTAAAGKSE